MENTNIVWLLNNAGPIIRYRVLNDIYGFKSDSDRNAAITNLLGCSEVRKWVELLKSSKRIHGSDNYALENSLAKLTAYGITADMDNIATIISSVYIDKFEDEVEANTDAPGILYPFFVSMKYFNNKSVIQYALNRLKMLSSYALQVTSDFQNSDNIDDLVLSLKEKVALGIPIKWYDKIIWKPEFVNLFPHCYDVYMFSYLQGHDEERAIILNFINTKKFQLLCAQREFNGSYCWNEKKKYCWSTWEMPFMHGYFDFSTNHFSANKFLLYMDIISRYPNTNLIAWFRNGLHYLEQFKTETNRYQFAPEYLPERQNGYYLYRGVKMRLGEKGIKSIEIESTFRMELLRKSFM